MEHICARTFPGTLFYQDVNKGLESFPMKKNATGCLFMTRKRKGAASCVQDMISHLLAQIQNQI